MAGWRGTCRALNWGCMLYRWLAGELVMIAVSRWPWWQFHTGRPRPSQASLSVHVSTRNTEQTAPEPRAHYANLHTPLPSNALAQPLHNTFSPQSHNAPLSGGVGLGPWERGLCTHLHRESYTTVSFPVITLNTVDKNGFNVESNRFFTHCFPNLSLVCVPTLTCTCYHITKRKGRKLRFKVKHCRAQRPLYSLMCFARRIALAG